ncbi:MAG: hypothetical protein U0893_19645 [Chloroflexota bacterium]
MGNPVGAVEAVPPWSAGSALGGVLAPPEESGASVSATWVRLPTLSSVNWWRVIASVDELLGLIQTSVRRRALA